MTTTRRLTYLITLCALCAACTAVEEPTRSRSDALERNALPNVPPPPEEAPVADEAIPEEDKPTEEEAEAVEAEKAEAEAPEEAPVAAYDGPEPLMWADLKNPAMLVRQKPDKKSDRVGTVRRGRAFPVFEYAEGKGCKKPWARIGPGWTCSDNFVEASGPPSPTVPLPFKYGVVYEDTEIHRSPSKHTGTGKIRKRRSTVTILEETKRWVRTWPDQWLRRHVVGPREVRVSSLKGEHITDETPMPLAFIRRNHTYAYPEPGLKKGERRRLESERVKISRFTRTQVLEEHPKGAKWGGQHIRVEGGWLDRHQVGIVKVIPRPKGINEDDRWILIDLSEQTVVAYEGDKPVFATLTSTGKGTSGPESFTPVGKWRIKNKLRSSRMAGGTGDSYHFLSDVPWVQYFHGGYAIHGVYWHNGFGWPLSQGCINLTPHDAQWIFHFTGPEMPTGWYSSLDLTRGKGTWVVVKK